jgi:hypothetical protein
MATTESSTSFLPVLLLGAVLTTLSACSSQRPVVPEQSGTIAPLALGTVSASDVARMETEYTALVAKLRESPQLADAKRLREVYVRTSRYQPYGADGFPQDQIFAAADSQRWAECRAEAEKVLDRNYMDLNAHLGAMVCNREDGRKTEAAHHETMLRQLLDAIRSTGDGKSPATAFETYYTPELYAFLGLNGLETVSQALSDENGQWFDVMAVKDRETGKEFSLYFNITWQWIHGHKDEGE